MTLLKNCIKEVKGLLLSLSLFNCHFNKDDGQDFDDGDGGAQANQEAPAQGNLAPVETRRQQLLQVFQ